MRDVGATDVEMGGGGDIYEEYVGISEDTLMDFRMLREERSNWRDDDRQWQSSSDVWVIEGLEGVRRSKSVGRGQVEGCEGIIRSGAMSDMSSSQDGLASFHLEVYLWEVSLKIVTGESYQLALRHGGVDRECPMERVWAEFFSDDIYLLSKGECFTMARCLLSDLSSESLITMWENYLRTLGTRHSSVVTLLLDEGERE
ncbi:hypothetical protein Tco_0858443 [Tanacetum coccineum]|uniref:Uncharacterized protein n=1 Tax=Tanacetum coccineum TaxID=301880 RepID=A0ABQ5BCZ2_9ASTR